MKEKILGALSTIKRPGMPSLMAWLRSNEDNARGFFGAPASTKYHLAEPGGLAIHSWNVFKELEKLKAHSLLDTVDNDSIAICGLLHDVCKVNFYREGSRNVKDPATGQWSAVACYDIDDEEPLGHGEKSVILLSRFISLTPDEELAIRWHMGLWLNDNKRTLNQAMAKSRLLKGLILADQMATFFMED